MLFALVDDATAFFFFKFIITTTRHLPLSLLSYILVICVFRKVHVNVGDRTVSNDNHKKLTAEKWQIFKENVN